MSEAPALKVPTTRFGEIEVAADTVITFPQGLVGLPQLRRFVLIEGKGPFQWMQCVENPDATFVVIDSDEVVTDYAINPSREDLAIVAEGEEPAPLCALLIVTVPREAPERMTANLMAPLIVNTARRVAVQAVLPDRYPVRHPIVMERAAENQLENRVVPVA
jgi:flagellar assembly factor FliW